jgi:hypothetical protein
MTSNKRRAIEGDGVIKSRATEDDVEGHVMKAKGVEGDDLIKSRASDEDDVEGHLMKAKGVEGDDLIKSRASDEDDVEGHSIGVMNPILAHELSRARERDIQREASRNSLIGDAKRALKRKR